MKSVTKVKTSLRISVTVLRNASIIGEAMGMGRGDLVSLALALMVVRFGVLIPGQRKRKQLLDEVECEVQSLLHAARDKSGL